MNIKLFGHRCLVEYCNPKTKTKIVIPDIAQQFDTHRFGIVRFIGDGKVKNQAEPVPSLVQPGDMVMFQINNIMESTQKYVLNGKHYLHMLQDELIARINGDDLTLENLEILGDYILLKHFIRQNIKSNLVVPDHLLKHSAQDFIYFKCIKKGSTVGNHFEEGNELIVNFGKLTPIFFIKRNSDGTSENQEYAYTRKEWVDGVVLDTKE